MFDVIDASKGRYIRQEVPPDRLLCFFGMGVLLEDCYDELVLACGREPDFLCDNASSKWDGFFRGRPRLRPDRLLDVGERVVVVITVKRYESIREQLTSMGVTSILLASFDRGSTRLLNLRSFERLDSKHSVKALDLHGRWALITGAGRGAGRRIARGMAQQGVHIMAHGRTESSVIDVMSECHALGVDVLPAAANLENIGEVDAMLDRLEALGHPIDVVFNNAGVSPAWSDGFWAAPPDDFLNAYAINVLAPVRICQRLIPSMVRRGFGRVVNVSSSIQKRPGEIAYACSKAALDKFVHDLAPSLAGTGVMLSLMDPGWLRTDMGGPGAPHDPETILPGALLGALMDGDVNGRWFGAQDYAGMTLEAALNKAAFILAGPLEETC